MGLLDDLNEQQREAVTSIHGPLLVVAGPGSGKTRVITARIAYMIEQGVPPWRILAMTFTNKAAGEMKARVQRLVTNADVYVSTFHSFGAWLMRREAETLGYAKDFSIYDTDDRDSLIRRLMREANIDSSFVTASAAGYAISDAKNRAIDPATYLSGAFDPKTKAVAEIFALYEKALKQAQAMDFDDLLIKPLELFTKHSTALEKYRDRFSHILIDEYQDTNAVQYNLAKLLAQRDKNICVTGDPDQSIYSWRGADIRNILSFERDFPGAKVVILGQNYRSTKRIVQAADALVRHNLARKEKPLSTSNDEGTRIKVLRCQNETHEALEIARGIEKLREEHDVPLSGVAVFYRMNAQSRALEQGLRERNIAYQLVGAVAFYQRQEIKDVLAYLRLIVNPRDVVSFARALLRPSRGVGEGTLEKIVVAARDSGKTLIEVARDPAAHGISRVQKKALEALRDFAAMYDRLLAEPLFPIETVIEKVLLQSGYMRALQQDIDPRAEDRIDNVKELLSDAKTREQNDADLDLSRWLEQIALVSDTDKLDLGNPAVTLMTLHSAKGLEFPAVFIVGLEDGCLPHARSLQGEGDPEEERRLCYVGITRAQKFLTLTHARHREQFGQFTRNAPSRFLAEIPHELCEIHDISGGHAGFAAEWDAATKFTPRIGAEHQAGSNPFDFGDMPPIEDNPADFAAARGAASGVRSPESGVDGGFPSAFDPGARTTHTALTKGDRVRHSVFGIGQVLEMVGSGDKARVRVSFQGWGEKNLALEFARLEKL
ncbi:MAG: UvrD-helicase domain-containing protein [Planctomycetes bacterium]|nr:UvrD-helicase domain-containing protein [Planctomycetota bacterium]